MQLWIVDRTEGDTVILETPQGKFVGIPRCLFHTQAREGDVCKKEEDGSFSVLPEETEKRRKKLEALTKKIFENR